MVLNHTCGASTKAAVIGNAIDRDFAQRTAPVRRPTWTHLLKIIHKFRLACKWNHDIWSSTSAIFTVAGGAFVSACLYLFYLLACFHCLNVYGLVVLNKF